MGGASARVSNCAVNPRFSSMARIAAALRWMLGSSLAKFGIASKLENSCRMSRSCCVRQSRACRAIERESEAAAAIITLPMTAQIKSLHMGIAFTKIEDDKYLRSLMELGRFIKSRTDLVR